MLKSRSKFPPGGWRFFQPQTGWRPTGGATFDQVVNSIIRHRQTNNRFGLPTDYDTVARELEIYTEKRLRAMPGTESLYVSTGDDTIKKAMSPARRLGAAAGAVVASVRRTKAGIKTLLEWLGSGAKPIERDAAIARAMICVNCPQNKKGSLYQWMQSRIADEVQELVEVAKDMQLSTPVDDKLEVCQACDCNLPLKIWVPIDHIVKNMDDDVKAKLDPSCWITKPQ